MRKTLGVAALMLAFCCPTLAGEIPTPPAPPPQPATAVQESSDADQEPTANGIMPNDAAESLTQTALDLLALLQSLL
jgi:hypothetical protein